MKSIDPNNEETEDYLHLKPKEGWHVIHLFYQIDRSQWSLLSPSEQREAKTALTERIGEIRKHPDTQLLAFSMVTPKADIGFMLLTPDLHEANLFEKQITQALGPDILIPTYSYLSMTERSEYTTTQEQYEAQMTKEKGLQPGTKEMEEAVQTFQEHMERYLQDRLYPNMADWPIFCFYPMAKKRSGEDNWYSLEFEDRRKLMQGHAKIGRQWAGKIRQLITGSVGLDESEWGVTLFAKDTIDVKEIVYEMRFDEVSARYGEFGDFYIGIQLDLKDLFERLIL